MPKKKRTLKQKIQADTRYTAPAAPHVTTEAPSNQYTLEHLSLPKTKPRTMTVKDPGVISTSEYAYIAPDLRKTFFLTMAIVFVALFIRYFAIANY